jgi:hypothetical protein
MLFPMTAHAGGRQLEPPPRSRRKNSQTDAAEAFAFPFRGDEDSAVDASAVGRGFG